jgi:hypothetical protein
MSKETPKEDMTKFIARINEMADAMNDIVDNCEPEALTLKEGQQIQIMAKVLSDTPDGNAGIAIAAPSGDFMLVYPEDIAEAPRWQRMTLDNMPEHGQLCAWITVDRDEDGMICRVINSGVPNAPFVRLPEGWDIKYQRHLPLEPYTEEACDGYYWFPLPKLPTE